MNRGKSLLLASAILLISTIVAYLMVWLRPEPEIRPLTSRAPFAVTASAVVGTGAIPVYGAGTVRPVAKIDVAAEINGKVVWVDPAFQSGGRVRKGQILFRIDDADYRNRVQQARANVAAQHVALLRANEEAQIARAEYAQFRRDQTDIAKANPLALWEPQLEAARASVARDSAVLADAELALARTKVRAPFRGVVQTESIDVGQFVVAGQSVGRLYATDAVEVVVPLSDANAALIPGLWRLEAGDGDRQVKARVIAEYGDGSYAWEGYVDRAEASLDEQTRTINVIVRVPNPFTSGTPVEGAGADPGPPLLVGKFAEVRIEGIIPDQYFILRRSALRPGNEVWAVRDDTLLTIVPVRVLQRSDDKVFVTGTLKASQAVVIGGIQIATEGMVVRIGGAP
ncbi:MAG: efflux RND transporter periplasmic adaptor subunit [Gemmatimonadetes bacterium]|nr:efflux RND transporter periplasmic adaptor subunit [Gemmatimonadota bacterium]MYF75704.1 efflux RND transporter periplasmic adaptor subunit [Gemmatimonadota bacterium]MYK52041.1 efflux RND transporter periplasmic adaptor subunit [Gemmatimonadota bacterium]